MSSQKKDFKKLYNKYKNKYLKLKNIDSKKLSLNDNLIGGARKESSGLPIEIIKNSERLEGIEYQMIKDLESLFEMYDLNKYLYSKKIIVDPNVNNIPHSYDCVITITRRYVINKENTLEHLLARFIHEQFHCWEEQSENQTKIKKLLPILYEKFPNIRLENPFGSITKESTYNHIIICFHEYKGLIDLLGSEKAKEILENPRFYRDIYGAVLNNFEQIEDLLKEHDLLP